MDKQLLEAGDARLDADEAAKAVEIWKSVIERYPRSKHRYEAHLRLGKRVDPEPFRREVNDRLPHDVHILSLAPVPDTAW